MVSFAELSGVFKPSNVTYSHQAAYANPWIHSQECFLMRPSRLQGRRAPCFLRVVSNNPVHDSALHSSAIYGLRIALESHESVT